jgi:hypothetical protein
MHLRNYIKLLFVLMLTISVWLFVFSAYALVAGRAMEKQYTSNNQEFIKVQNASLKSLQLLYVTFFEQQQLSGDYNVTGFFAKRCYLPEEDSTKTDDAVNAIKKYNTECKQKWIPELEIRPEVKDVFKKWGEAKANMESKTADINSRLYADHSGKGKLDTAILDIFTKMAGIGTAISVLVLILIYRIPETPSERRDEHPKSK